MPTFPQLFGMSFMIIQIIYKLAWSDAFCASGLVVMGFLLWEKGSGMQDLRAAVCKYREFAVKTEILKFFISSLKKNPLVKHFRKSQSKFRNNFLFRENRQKVKCCPTPYSRRSKIFELYHFQSPREERRFKETSSSLSGK